ncbi:MAG: hypothetical protein A2284_03220 [Deltaproteobacteria bacterium RIFOXYA12_FULL_61_11]|nr:MAG: hypothetical protein A2284_03220 [Deltaproteobacteria bacterium RIFOXYA12_FULL_61_11]
MRTRFATCRTVRDPGIDLDLTPLLDVLTLLVVFFLLLYGDQTTESLPDDLNLPTISSTAKAQSGLPLLQLNDAYLYFEQTLVATLTNGRFVPEELEAGVLKRLREQLEPLLAGQPTTPALVLSADKNSSMAAIRVILRTAAAAGITDVRFLLRRR